MLWVKNELHKKKKDSGVVVFEYINNLKLGLSLTAFHLPHPFLKLIFQFSRSLRASDLSLLFY